MIVEWWFAMRIAKCRQAVLPFDEALHLQLRSSVVEILAQSVFSHSLDPKRTLAPFLLSKPLYHEPLLGEHTDEILGRCPAR
jgi:hypothetical protein